LSLGHQQIVQKVSGGLNKKMKQKDYIEVEAMTGYDPSYREETEDGTICGRELTKTVRIPIEDAVHIVQAHVYRLDYDAAADLAAKYKEK